MKKYLKFLFSRLPFIVLLIMIQIGWIAVFFSRLNQYASWISSVFTVLSFFMFLSVIVASDNPDYKIIWIIVIGVVPIFGGLMYLLWGDKRPAKRLNNKIHMAEKSIYPLLSQDSEVIDRLPSRLKQTSKYIADTGKYPVYQNTEVQYFKVGEDMYEAMLKDLKDAKEFIFMEFFIIKKGSMWDSIRELLIYKAKEGLDVRLMYDDMGCLGHLPIKDRLELKDAGVKVVIFNRMKPIISSIMNNRDHRKILVVDGNIGYNGGINIADEYINLISPYGHWKDTGVRLYGEAVWNLSSMFLSLWDVYEKGSADNSKFKPSSDIEYRSDGFIQPFSDSPFDYEDLSNNVYLEIIWQAVDYVYIFTPYLIIDFEMTSALTMAAKRGVDVRIVVPGVPDKKVVYELTQSYFEQLMDAGVKIYKYSPGFIHAKSYLSDDQVAIVGTINMDYRSLYLHFECGTYMVNNSAIYDIKKDYVEVFRQSRLLNESDINRSSLVRIYRAILRVVSPLF